jgi:hypothetical protein
VETCVPDHQQSQTSQTSSSSSSSQRSGGNSGSGSGNAAALEQVVVYLTQNNTRHEKDEIPETLAALQKADSLGLGKKSLLPISDPFANGHQTYDYSMGEEKASAVSWWHDDDALKSGQARLNGEVLDLGASEYADGDNLEFLAKMQRDWRTMMSHIGLSDDKCDEVVAALLTDAEGKAKLTDSGGRASNELIQLISVLNRAENGEFEISSLVLSGHHYSGSDEIFGELPGHNYDTAPRVGDTLNMHDIEALKDVFPKAYSQVDSFMFSACNTHNLGMKDDECNGLSTPEWVSGVFPEASKMAHWEGIAPGSDTAAFWSGEFMLDVAKEDSGQSGAFNDAMWRNTKKGQNKRFEKGEDGKFSDVNTARNGSSYVYNDYKGLRDSAGEDYTRRSDLMRYIKK